MLSPDSALSGALHRVQSPARRPRRVLVLGGGGALGGAVLEQLLACHRFEQVGVLTQDRLQPALRGLQTVADDLPSLARFGAETALVVFDRQRHANGRDDAFVRPLPDELAARAAQLRAVGVRALLVVVPHSPALLPAALKLGLASLDEAAVAALGFAHLVFMRMAQAEGPDGTRRSSAQRLAGWMLAQLHWMVAQRDQPVRAATVARLAAALAVALPDAAPGTRVLPPEWLALAAQSGDAAGVAADWLAGRRLPAAPVRQRW